MDTQELLAPMVATVVRVEVEPGVTVRAGQPVVVLESMKLEHVVRVPVAGLVTLVKVAAGDTVRQDQPLLSLAPAEAFEEAVADPDDRADLAEVILDVRRPARAAGGGAGEPGAGLRRALGDLLAGGHRLGA